MAHDQQQQLTATTTLKRKEKPCVIFSEIEQSNFGTKPYTYEGVAKTEFLTKDSLLSTSLLPNLVAYYIFPCWKTHHFLSFQFKQFNSIVLPCVVSIDSWFQGCIALLRYSSEAKPFENVKLLGSKGVWENCSGEACSRFEQNKCKHGGICVDLVVKTECDCKGTGYYGRFCERSGNEL